MEPNQNNNNPLVGGQILGTKAEDLPDLGPKNLNIPSTIRSVDVSDETLKAFTEQNNQSQTPNTGFQPNSMPNPWQTPKIKPQDSEVFTNQQPTLETDSSG